MLIAVDTSLGITDMTTNLQGFKGQGVDVNKPSAQQFIWAPEVPSPDLNC